MKHFISKMLVMSAPCLLAACAQPGGSGTTGSDRYVEVTGLEDQEGKEFFYHGERPASAQVTGGAAGSAGATVASSAQSKVRVTNGRARCPIAADASGRVDFRFAADANSNVFADTGDSVGFKSLTIAQSASGQAATFAAAEARREGREKIGLATEINTRLALGSELTVNGSGFGEGEKHCVVRDASETHVYAAAKAEAGSLFRMRVPGGRGLIVIVASDTNANGSFEVTDDIDAAAATSASGTLEVNHDGLIDITGQLLTEAELAATLSAHAIVD